MNIEVVYKYLVEIRQNLIDYIKKCKEKGEVPNAIVSIYENGISYSFGKIVNVDLTKEEVDMIAHFLSSNLGFSSKLTNDKLYDLKLEDLDKLVNSDMCESLDSFKSVVDKSKEEYEHKMLGVVRDLAATNNKDSANLIFEVSEDMVMCFGDGVNLVPSRYQAKLLSEMLGKYGVVKNEGNSRTISISDTSNFWKDTCKDGEYNVRDLSNTILQTLSKLKTVNARIIVRDFSISVNGVTYYYEKGLSPSIKSNLVSVISEISATEIQMIGSDYIVDARDYSNLLEPEESGKHR